MDKLQKEDVPYGNAWDSAIEVAAYGKAADLARPWRHEIREHIAERIAGLAPGSRILELGSGPGLLAHCVLQRCPNLENYTLLDFSEPMLALSRERLADFPIATFEHVSFKCEDWIHTIDGPFDCVVSMQAVHELRHKRHAPRLYEQVCQLLAVPGLFLICDHTPFDNSSKNIALYMDNDEQHEALSKAGFTNVRTQLKIDSLALYSGEKRA